MTIRPFQPKDLDRLKEIHSNSGFEYQFPDLSELVEKTVIVDDNDVVVMFLGAMPSVEFYLFSNPDWETPGMRWESFKLLHEYMRRRMVATGVIEAHIFLPPQIVKHFGRRLTRHLGWTRSFWACFSRRQA